MAGEGIVCGDDCGGDFVEGATVTLAVLADAASLFTGWEDVRCGEGSQEGSSCTFRVASPARAGARFERAVYLFAAASGSGDVTTDVPGGECGEGCLKFPSGTPITVTVVPDEGWTFSFWSDPACRGSRRDPCSLVLDESTTVVPVFAQPGEG